MDFNGIRGRMDKTASVNALAQFVEAANVLAVSLQDLCSKTASVDDGKFEELASENPDLIIQAQKVAEALGEDELAGYLDQFTPKPITPDGFPVSRSSVAVAESADLFESMLKSAGYGEEDDQEPIVKTASADKIMQKSASIRDTRRIEDAAAEAYLDPYLCKCAEVGDLKTIEILGPSRVSDSDALVAALRTGLEGFNKAASKGLQRMYKEKEAEKVQTVDNGYDTDESHEEAFENLNRRARANAININSVSVGLGKLLNR